ncbi:MAG: MFS transporter, partial [Solirubrobacteraceae bacterium]
MAATTTRARRLGVDADHEHYKWWALSCTSLGMLMATINSGTLIIALPDLERALGTSILELVWVILAYMIASTVLVLTAGRLSDLFGRKVAYVAGFAVFAAASLGAGFAHSGTELILWRIVQGIGGAFLFANSTALVTDAFPREQLGLAMGTNTMVAAIGLVIGPVLGGALVSISWHWVFWFNV